MLACVRVCVFSKCVRVHVGLLWYVGVEVCVCGGGESARYSCTGKGDDKKLLAAHHRSWVSSLDILMLSAKSTTGWSLHRLPVLRHL